MINFTILLFSEKYLINASRSHFCALIRQLEERLTFCSNLKNLYAQILQNNFYFWNHLVPVRHLIVRFLHLLEAWNSSLKVN